MLTVPDGSAESFDSSVSWVACNLAYAASQWSNVRARAASLGIKVVPWIRLAHAEDNFEIVKQRLSLLISTAQAWGTDTILPNYENEAERFSPAAVADYLYGYADWDGLTGWSTQAWLPNRPDFTPLNKDPVLLQIFPQDNRWDPWEIPQKLGDCVAHARNDKGFTYVGVTYQTFGGANPSWYDCESFMHSTFSGNLIQPGQWGSWYR